MHTDLELGIGRDVQTQLREPVGMPVRTRDDGRGRLGLQTVSASQHPNADGASRTRSTAAINCETPRSPLANAEVRADMNPATSELDTSPAATARPVVGVDTAWDRDMDSVTRTICHGKRHTSSP